MDEYQTQMELDAMTEYFEYDLNEIGFVEPEIRYTVSFSQGDGFSFTFSHIEMEQMINSLAMCDVMELHPYIDKAVFIREALNLSRMQERGFLSMWEQPRITNHMYTHELTVSMNHGYELYGDLPDIPTLADTLGERIDFLYSVIEDYRRALCQKYYSMLKTMVLEYA